jgi:hypothetical protein
MNQRTQELLTGAHGIVNETGTTALTGRDFFAVQCLTETVFATFTENDVSGDAITNVTLPAGTVIINNAGITAVTLTSGAVRCYKRNR